MDIFMFTGEMARNWSMEYNQSQRQDKAIGKSRFLLYLIFDIFYLFQKMLFCN